MIIEENVSDTLVRHYSDQGFMIRQIETGIEYSEAVDVIPCTYTYEETDKMTEQSSDAELQDAAEAAKILLGMV